MADARPQWSPTQRRDKDGYFRTEVNATLNKLNVEGGVLTVDRITLGLVSMYRRNWFDNGKEHGKRVRVLPYSCSIENLLVRGKPVKDYLPAPFHYSTDRCESYLRGERARRRGRRRHPRRHYFQSIALPATFPNFGRIFFGEWTLLPSADWHPIHQVYMVRMALGSPQQGGTGGGGGQTDGTGG